MQQERLVNIVRRFSERKLLIVGDSIADKFLYGSISRVSREAPVFILRHESTETVPGGAANCALNLAALGANVSLMSIAGNDVHDVGDLTMRGVTRRVEAPVPRPAGDGSPPSPSIERSEDQLRQPGVARMR